MSEKYSLKGPFGETQFPLEVISVTDWRNLGKPGTLDDSEHAASVFHDPKAFDVYSTFSNGDDRVCRIQFSFSPMNPAYFAHIWPRNLNYPDGYPATRPYDINFGLQGKGSRLLITSPVFMMGVYNVEVSSAFQGRAIADSRVDYHANGPDISLNFGAKDYNLRLGGIYSENIDEPRYHADMTNASLYLGQRRLKTSATYYVLPHNEEVRRFSVKASIPEEAKAE